MRFPSAILRRADICQNNTQEGLITGIGVNSELGILIIEFASKLQEQGAGAVSRFNPGLVIATEIAIGTVFTLFVVPTMYLWIARAHGRRPASEATVRTIAPQEISG